MKDWSCREEVFHAGNIYTQVLFHWRILKIKLDRTIFRFSQIDIQAKLR